MSCRTASGTTLTPSTCDLDRTGSQSPGGITRAEWAPSSLPDGRYLHTKAIPDGDVFIAHGVNTRWLSDTSIAPLFSPTDDSEVDRIVTWVVPQKNCSVGVLPGRGSRPGGCGGCADRAISPTRVNSAGKEADAHAFAYRTYTMARLASADIDVAEVHDYLTMTHSIGYEDLDFAETPTTPEGPVADGK